MIVIIYACMPESLRFLKHCVDLECKLLNSAQMQTWPYLQIKLFKTSPESPPFQKLISLHGPIFFVSAQRHSLLTKGINNFSWKGQTFWLCNLNLCSIYGDHSGYSQIFITIFCRVLIKCPHHLFQKRSNSASSHICHYYLRSIFVFDKIKTKYAI